MIEKEQPIEPALRELMNDIGRRLGTALREATKGSSERYGFALLMFGLSGDEVEPPARSQQAARPFDEQSGDRLLGVVRWVRQGDVERRYS